VGSKKGGFFQAAYFFLIVRMEGIFYCTEYSFYILSKSETGHDLLKMLWINKAVA
jgi:hypothetical protein